MSNSSPILHSVKEADRFALPENRWFRFGRIIKRLPEPDHGEEAHYVLRIENEKGELLERFEVPAVPATQLLKGGDLLKVERYSSSDNSVYFSILKNPPPTVSVAKGAKSDVENGFRILKIFIKEQSVANKDSFYKDLDWLLKMEHWNDLIPGTGKAVQPKKMTGRQISKLLSLLDSEMAQVYKAGESLSPHRHYWLYSWFFVGVVDQKYFFCIDAKDPTVTAAWKYSSLD